MISGLDILMSGLKNNQPKKPLDPSLPHDSAFSANAACTEFSSIYDSLVAGLGSIDSLQ